MTAAKMARLLEKLRERLEATPSFVDDVNCELKLIVTQGGLADVVFTSRLDPPKKVIE
jgi:hypothetical protein